jgi:predicted metal-dependent phosphoesterase TrpH
LIRVDLHVHSSASFDCSVEPEQVAARCRRLGLAPVFLTDHDSIEGALRLGTTTRVVVGQEVMTTAGEMIGLFLNRQVPAGLAPKAAATAIKDQGGLLYVEHPYDPVRRHLSEVAIEDLADAIDIVEVYNGRSDDKANRRAEDLCATLGAAPGAGSDAHTIGEIGSVYVEMADFDGAGDFLMKLRHGKIVKRRMKWLLMADVVWPKIRRP